MAANNNRILVGNSRRERALGAVTPAPALPAAGGGGARGARGARGRRAPQDHYISVLAKSPRVDQGFADAYGGPPGILAPWGSIGGHQQVLDDYFQTLYPRKLAAQGHPLGDDEGRTHAFFMEMLTQAVLPIVNWPFNVQHDARIGINQPANQVQRDPRIHITGKSGIVIRSNNVPRCVVELKRYEANERLFNVGRRQAMLYAAAIGFQQRRPMVAIVTDLARWQFLRVDAGSYATSPVVRVDYDRRGVQDQVQLSNVLRSVGGFLLTNR